MFTLSAAPNAAEYIANNGQECLLGKAIVTIASYTNYSRSGSYERGFKFSNNTYGSLRAPSITSPRVTVLITVLHGTTHLTK